ncbi:2-oxoglutarate dehydrogenase E1 component domain protein [Mycolicibacterium hassiacum DSM 44199]|uniref:2-oxoglutarate dehydrogenase E1 component domain protein n=1 Tax=Mycolicibacterium hassiacum (strain DSM 44199 / CIP 105218 / JCM 12690 / 3849) TaxID=1122247 RepID=K5BJB8_MYCHD|nr:2-oxoglutarate dehydrogenase E1 component domain protein [Mycolicibacterium hassiacum DSM 44199]
MRTGCGRGCGRRLGRRHRRVAGLTVAAFVEWLGRVVGEELMPTRIYRGGVLAELAIHLLDQPLVLPEWRR